MVLVLDGGEDERPQLLERGQVAPTHQLVPQTHGNGPLVVVQPVEDRFLRLEMVVDGALGEVAEVVQDVLDGRLLVALLGKQPPGRIEDAMLGLLGMCVTCHMSSNRLETSIHTIGRFVN